MDTADGVALEAGRELDERIAREVMKLCVHEFTVTWEDDGLCESWTARCKCGLKRAGTYGNLTPLSGQARPYSTDRAAAFEVVDRLIAAGLWVLLDIIPGNAEVTISEGEAGIAAGYSDSLPLAICRASLHPGVVEHLERLRP